MDNRKAVFIAIIGVCILAVIAGLFTQVKSNKKKQEDDNRIDSIQTDVEAKESFDSIFDDAFDPKGSEIFQVDKLNENEEALVYEVSLEDKTDFYELNIKLPVINIKTNIGNRLNTLTQNIFANKANAIKASTEGYSIFTSTYTSYLKDNVLYVIIKSTLKENDNAQRTIVQTYAYDLANNKELTINRAIEMVGTTEEEVTAKIQDIVSKKISESSELDNSGYDVYKRDLENDMYKLENIDTFYIGKDGKLYIVFAYGNTGFTSEMDIIVI